MNVAHLAAWAVILGIDNSGGGDTPDAATTAYCVVAGDAFVIGDAAGEGFEIGHAAGEGC